MKTYQVVVEIFDSRYGGDHLRLEDGCGDFLICLSDSYVTGIVRPAGTSEQRLRDEVGKGGFNPNFESPVPLEKLGLTPREAEVLVWVAQGKSNGDIAVICGMAEKTVKKHLGNVFQKLGVEGRNAATLCALEVLSSPQAGSRTE